MAGSIPSRPEPTTAAGACGSGYLLEDLPVHGLRALPAQMIVGGVDHDAVEPGGEAGVAFEGVEVPEGLYERLLSDIGRVPGITKGTKGQVVHPASRAAVELGQGVGIPAASSFDEMSIGVAHLRGQAQASSLLLKLHVLPRASHSNRVDYAKVDLTCMRARGEE